MSDSGALKKKGSGHSIYVPRKFPLVPESWMPISSLDEEFIMKIEASVNNKKLVRVIDVFNVQQGIRSGRNDVFIIDSNRYNDLPPAEKEFFKPVANNDTIRSRLRNKDLYIWYPYDSNGSILHNESDLSSKAPNFYNYLSKHKDVLMERARKDSTNWWELSEHRAWQTESCPRLFSAEFGNASSFVFDKNGSFVVERGNSWNPKKEHKGNGFYYFYLGLFSSPFFDRLLRLYSRQLAGGNWYDLGKAHTKNIPIPNFFSPGIAESKNFSDLINVGKIYFENGLYPISVGLSAIEFFYL
jgi:adenine-specific DNA-methyltransferase